MPLPECNQAGLWQTTNEVVSWLQDVEIIFSMFDDDNSGAISLAEFLHVTSSLQKRLHHVSPIKRTGLQTEAG